MNKITKILDIYEFVHLNRDGMTAHVTEDVIFEPEKKYPFKSTLLPIGFISNFASVPRFLWALYPPTGRYSAAAVLHDWLYTEKKLSRKLCDDALYVAMVESGVGPFDRRAIYYSVRLFGAPYYGTK